MRVIVYCREILPNHPAKVVAVYNSASGNLLPVPRIGEHVVVVAAEGASLVENVTWDYREGLSAWVRIPTDYDKKYKEMKL